MTIFGKATEVLKTSVPLEVREDFGRKWRELGYESESAAIRALVEIATYGADHIESLHRTRVRRMAERMAIAGTDRVSNGEG